MTLADLRSAYQSGAARPTEVMEAALERIKDPDQDAVWISSVEPSKAMDAARRLEERAEKMAELPLYGALFSVKDNIDVAGEPTTAACPAFAYVAESSAPVVEAAEAAGALYLGKTNMDQFATGLVGVRSPYGIPTNPFNKDYIPGGSSSGAGVSVATGAAHFAFGSDTGGSGRVPACYNGIVGLKPAPGSLSRRGMVYACRSFDTPSIFAPTGADAAAVFDAVARGDPQDPFMRIGGGGQAPSCGLEALRIAVPEESQLKFFGDSETPALFEQARSALAAEGASISRFDFSPLDAIGRLMFFGPLLAERDVSVGRFIDRAEECEQVVRDLILSSRRFSAADAYQALYQIAEQSAALRDLWSSADVLLLPTVGALYRVDEVLAEPLEHNFNNGYYTNFANPLGVAAIACPFGRHSSGLRYSVTFVGPAGSESALCAIGEAFARLESC